MNARYLAIAGGSLLLLGASVLPAFAAGTAAIGATTGVTATAVGVTTGLSGALNGTVGSSGSTTVTTQTSTTSTITTQVDLGGSGSTSNGTAGANAAVSLMSSDPAVVDFGSSVAPTASDAAAVQTSDQLNTYAEGMMHADTNVQAVQSSDTMVSVSYKKPGELLGFIPMSITEQGEVSNDGTVTVTYPWYHFLVSTNDDANLQTKLQTQIQPMLNTNMNGTFSAQQQAQIMATLYAGMSANS